MADQHFEKWLRKIRGLDADHQEFMHQLWDSYEVRELTLDEVYKLINLALQKKIADASWTIEKTQVRREGIC